MERKQKTVHGHYSNILEDEAKRIQALYRDKLKIDITWTEATSIAALRSSTTYLNGDDLKKLLARLRGL